jgi:GTPase SAR1 family protein
MLPSAVQPVKLDGVKVKLNFWDLSGDDAYLEVRNEFYKDAQCVRVQCDACNCCMSMLPLPSAQIVVVYDATKPESFEELGSWIAESRQFGAAGLPSVLIANKVDKTARVPPERGQAFASKHGMQFFEASAASGVGVQDAFDWLVRKAAATSYPGTVAPP